MEKRYIDSNPAFNYRDFMVPAYQQNVSFLSKYGDSHHRLTTIKNCRVSGVELPPKEYTQKNTINDTKLDNNIQRARSTIVELGFCNEWDLFVTLTISPEKHNRQALKDFKKKLNSFKKDMERRHGVRFAYLLIPEQHQDGAWHMHGFIKGLTPENLRLMSLDEKLPYHIRDKLQNGEEVYDWPAYRQRFGYCTLEPIRNTEAATRYISKYITKDMGRTVTELGGHLYYASKGLKRREVLKKGLYAGNIKPSHQGEYSSTTWFTNLGTDEINQITNDIEKIVSSPKEWLNRQGNIELMEECPWA